MTIRITAPEPSWGYSTFLDVDFHDGVAEVEDLHPIRRQALEQHGYAVVDVIEGVKLERLTKKELVKLAEDQGIVFGDPTKVTKAEIIERINADPTVEVFPSAEEAEAHTTEQRIASVEADSAPAVDALTAFREAAVIAADGDPAED